MDIVEKLRNINMQNDALCRNAADEIERLRDECRNLATCQFDVEVAHLSPRPIE